MHGTRIHEGFGLQGMDLRRSEVAELRQDELTGIV
jgi:hypothetical protein